MVNWNAPCTAFDPEADPECVVEYWHPECGPHECYVTQSGEEESCLLDFVDPQTWQFMRESEVFQDEDKLNTFQYWEDYHNQNAADKAELYEWILVELEAEEQQAEFDDTQLEEEVMNDLLEQEDYLSDEEINEWVDPNWGDLAEQPMVDPVDV